MNIKDWPSQERPREKLLRLGAGALSDAELLAIYLRTGVAGQSALDLARHLLIEFESLKGLLDAKPKAFCAIHGLGLAKYTQLHAVMEMSKRYYAHQMQSRSVMHHPEACRRYIIHALSGRHQEIFACLYLDAQHQVLQFEELFQGTLDSASVYPREVVHRVLEVGAAAVILCHNHPSGSSRISEADRAITRRLKEALALIDVKVLDHFVVADHEIISFAEQGIL